MKITVGQDALDRWAWMIHDKAGRLVASDDGYPDGSQAMEEALNQIDRRKRMAQREARERRDGLRAVG
jgi:hypothetical protein